jgi:hypothetical protein
MSKDQINNNYFIILRLISEYQNLKSELRIHLLLRISLTAFSKIEDIFYQILIFVGFKSSHYFAFCICFSRLS